MRRFYMNRWLMSFIYGVCITILLTIAGFSLSSDGGWSLPTKVLLWQATLLAYGIPHPNIGTAQHPIYEGTPLDLIPVFIGIPLGVPIYTLISYAVLWFFDKYQIKRRQLR